MRRSREDDAFRADVREMGDVVSEMKTDDAINRADEQARLSPQCEPECMRWRLCWACAKAHGRRCELPGWQP